MNIEIFARQSHGVRICRMTFEYLLAYSYDCGILLLVHDWRECIMCEAPNDYARK